MDRVCDSCGGGDGLKAERLNREEQTRERGRPCVTFSLRVAVLGASACGPATLTRECLDTANDERRRVGIKEGCFEAEVAVHRVVDDAFSK